MDTLGKHTIHYRELLEFKYWHDFVSDVMFDIFRRTRVYVNFLTNPHDRRSTFMLVEILVYEWEEEKHTCMNLTEVSPLVRMRTKDFTI